jgi:hypothetical protein
MYFASNTEDNAKKEAEVLYHEDFSDTPIDNGEEYSEQEHLEKQKLSKDSVISSVENNT